MEKAAVGHFKELEACRRVEKVLDRAAMWSDTLKSTVSVSPSLFSQFFSQTREHYVRRSEEVQVMLEI